MIIIGAGGHAKSIYDICQNIENLYFFDNVTNFKTPLLFNKKIIQSFEDLIKIDTDKKFILGLGGVKNRYVLYQKLINLGFIPSSVIAQNAQVSNSSNLDEALNIMCFAFIGADSKIGRGSIINVRSIVGHEVEIGEFVEVSPGVTILGNCKIGNFTTIGANATILPKIRIGKNVIVAAGSVVTKDIPDNCMVAGIPAVIKKELEPLNF